MTDHTIPPPTRQKRVLSILALLLLMVVLPVGSYYYLKAGFDYRQKALTDLAIKRPLGTYQWQTQRGAVITPDSFLHKTTLYFALSGNDLTANVHQQLQKLHEQFDERKDVAFIYLIADSTQAATLPADTAQCFTVVVSADELARQQKQVFGIQPPDNVILVDTALQVRQQYALSKTGDLQRLVAHTAVTLPVAKRRSAADTQQKN